LKAANLPAAQELQLLFSENLPAGQIVQVVEPEAT
jgi:hypothetical protein